MLLHMSASRPVDLQKAPAIGKLLRMELNRAIELLQSLSPEHLAESWDKVGLHVGDPQRDVTRALLCIDLTEAVLQEAIDANAGLIVAYHPPIFSPLAAVTTADTKQRIVLRAIEAGIAIYSPHTALDAAVGGTADYLAEIIGPGSVRPIHPTPGESGDLYKIVVFVPADKADLVRDAFAKAGAGVIGQYTHCTFAAHGQGTFLGSEAANPAVGQRGRLETVEELRLETVCPANRLAPAIAAMRAAHPYEEPAVDVYKLAKDPTNDNASRPQTGAGRILKLDQPMTLSNLVHRMKRGLLVENIEVASAGHKEITTVGVCPGAGGSLLADAGPLDAYVTGEMRHHDVLAAVDRGTAILLAGHTQTERPYLLRYAKRLAAAETPDAKGADVEWLVSKADQPPSVMR